MIAIIDYGMGNLRSVQKAIERVGGKALITQDPGTVAKAEKVILPGVGAIKPALAQLRSLGLIDTILEVIEKDIPFLGICLGFQLLFEKSSEGGEVPGLGIFPGAVLRFNGLKVPHMGWNNIQFTDPDCVLWKNIPDNSYVYFCHSYFAQLANKDLMASSTPYGVTFASAACHRNTFGVQFHPEKSQTVGLQILKNFIRISK